MKLRNKMSLKTLSKTLILQLKIDMERVKQHFIRHNGA